MSPNNDKFNIESNDVMLLHNVHESSNNGKLLFSSRSDDVAAVVRNFALVNKFLDESNVDNLGNNYPHNPLVPLHNDMPSSVMPLRAKYNFSSIEHACDDIFSIDIKRFYCTSNRRYFENFSRPCVLSILFLPSHSSSRLFNPDNYSNGCC